MPSTLAASAPAVAPPPRRRRLLRWLGGLLLLLLLVVAGAGLWLRQQLLASLPRLDGEVAVASPQAAVEITRDRVGVVTVRGESRPDVAYGLGFVHAQERFFQMDLQRRDGAGELAALIGPPLVEQDRSRRLHRFRATARAAFALAPPVERALVEAYAAGVNAGLEALGAPSFEYLALRAEPQAWQPEDSYLTMLAMYFVLQDPVARDEAARDRLFATLPPALASFLVPRGTPWDTPLVGGPVELPPLPSAEEVDLRRVPAAGPATAAGASGAVLPVDAVQEIAGQPGVGSNNFAVAAARTADGRAIVANDPHLGFQVPNIWFRTRLVWRDGAAERSLVGVTLPGIPLLVIGSNGDVAWGFTNSYIDTTDLVILESVPPGADGAGAAASDHQGEATGETASGADGATAAGPPADTAAGEGEARAASTDWYRTPAGPRRIEVVRETIEVAGAEPEVLEIRSSVWGPVVGRNAAGAELAARWVAHDPAILRLDPAIETGRSLEEAFAVAAGTGIPAQNLTLAERSGRVGWTLIGKVPRRFGSDGRRPTSWADGTAGWDGYLSSAEVPRVVDPADGVLWTANSRVVGVEDLAKVGDGGYDVGARARQIRDGLLALSAAREADLLAIALDDRALFLANWQQLLLELLESQAVAAMPAAAQQRLSALRDVVRDTWTGRASVDSAAYRVVRAFRARTQETLFEAYTAPAKAVDEKFRWWHLPHREAPLWTLVTTRPLHLLPADQASWEGWLLAVANRVASELGEQCPQLADCTWGARNTLRMQHPLAMAVPALGRFLDMPYQPLPGDEHLPRVQSPRFGASMRMVVSPGREQEGILHMPGGQSGHPLSPFYREGHELWVTGQPAPILPGETVHHLRLVPKR
jgi:penicillin amidase